MEVTFADLDVSDVTVVEGDSGWVDAVFRLTLTPAATEPEVVAPGVNIRSSQNLQSTFSSGLRKQFPMQSLMARWITDCHST